MDRLVQDVVDMWIYFCDGDEHAKNLLTGMCNIKEGRYIRVN
jgi:hypothetical protein